MPEAQLPIYQIQVFQAHLLPERHFYRSPPVQPPVYLKTHQHNFYLWLFITRVSGIHTTSFREYAPAPRRVFCKSPVQARR